MERDGALPGVSTGVVVAIGRRAVPCWPFPNQRGGKHASLARTLTKHATTKNGQIGQNGSGNMGVCRLQAETDLLPSLPPRARLEPHDWDHGPGVHAEADRFPFSQGFTFL
jgi:hypothetical protein